jgi:hypothetical protein
MHALMCPHGRDLDDLARELATDLDDGLSEPAADVPVPYPPSDLRCCHRGETPANHTKPTRGFEPRPLHYEGKDE